MKFGWPFSEVSSVNWGRSDDGSFLYTDCVESSSRSTRHGSPSIDRPVSTTYMPSGRARLRRQL